MNTNYVQHFRLAVTSVFECFSDCGVTWKPDADVTACRRDVCCVVGLTGRRKGCMVLELTRDCAINISATLANRPPSDFDESAVEAVISFSDLTARMVIYNLRELQLAAALPTVICGRDIVCFPCGVVPVTIPFTSDLGDFTLTYGWQDERNPSSLDRAIVSAGARCR